MVQGRRERLHAGGIDGAGRWLEAGDPAVVGRDPDRAAGVGAQRRRAHAGADQRRRAAARASRGPPRIVGVARLGHARVHRARRVLQQGRGREDVGARLTQRPDHPSITGGGGRGHVVGVPVAARVPGHVDHVLHRYRNTAQGTVRPAGGGGEEADHRVQRRSEAERPLIGGQQLEVGDLTGPLAPLDRVDQLSGEGGQGAFQVAEQVVHLGLPLADHEVTVDAAV